MTKINRQKLSKGTFLRSDNINEFVNEVKDNLVNGAIDTENLNYTAPTRLVFNTRIFKRDPVENELLWVDNAVAGDLGAWRTSTLPLTTQGYDISLFQHWTFTLPEPQENFNANGIQNDKSKNFTLNELTVQADNLHNPAAIFPNLQLDYFDNSLSGTDSMKLIVSLHRKTPSRKTGTYHWEEMIGSWEIPASIFLDGSLSRNPFIFKDLNLKLSPDSIYLLSIGAPTKEVEIDNAAAEWGSYLSIENIQIGLKLLSDLRADDYVSEDRVTGTLTVQNGPVKQSTETSITTVDIVAGAEITEASIQDNLEKLDRAAHRKLVGSYDDFGNYPNPPQMIGSTYGVQQIPLFNNNQILQNWEEQAHGEHNHVATTGPGFGSSGVFMPYNGNPFPVFESIPAEIGERRIYSVADRKFIPIHQPFTIHHIMLTYWTGAPWTLTTNRCENANTFFEVGVILHTWGRSDLLSRHQIAEAKFQPTTGLDQRTGNNIIVDQAYWLEQQNNPIFQNATKKTCGFTVQIPVNHGTTLDKQGNGYVVTGQPLYIGQGQHGTTAGLLTARTGIFRRTQDDTLVNYTRGCEQMLEVIVKITNEVDGVTLNYPQGDETTYDSSIKVQQPGMMMYLTGKSPLQNPRW
jgi:hypothetical protein